MQSIGVRGKSGWFMQWLVVSMLATIVTAGCGASAPHVDEAPSGSSASAVVSPDEARQAKPAIHRELASIDVFGSRHTTTAMVLAGYELELRRYAEASMRRDGNYDSTQLFEEIANLGSFAYLAPALVGYYVDDGMKYYMTIDLVDRDDAEQRMPFGAQPTGTYQDPDELIASWTAYHAKVFDLMAAGQMRPDEVSCPAFHCVGDYSHPEVRGLFDKMKTNVPARAHALAEILRDSGDEWQRASAAYLLAFTTDGSALVNWEVEAFRDPSSLVRNSAMRVVAHLATYHPDISIPVEPVLAALNYPATTDRNKAAAILDALLLQPDGPSLHDRVIAQSGSVLLAMLRLQQPNNHDFAYSILKTISGESYDERDYSAWDEWVATQVP